MLAGLTRSGAARAGLALGLGALVAAGGWRRGALSGDGALAAAVVGAATFGCGGPGPGVGLVTFFVTGSALSRRPAVPGEVVAAKGHQRDAVQVLANGGIAALASVLATRGSERARGAALGALAAAAADTWASELGVRSAQPPRSILDGEIVPPGTSGGVTALGWGAAALGALVVGAAATLAARAGASRPGHSVQRAVRRALLAGLAGSLADSLAGATVQAAYRCAGCDAPAEAPGEHCGRPRTLVRGLPWVTNDAVNAIGTATGALVGALV